MKKVLGGHMSERNIFIEEGISEDDFDGIDVPGELLRGVLHGTNYVWRLNETPDKKRVSYFIIKGEETPWETLVKIVEMAEGVPLGAAVDGVMDFKRLIEAVKDCQ